MKIAVFSDIHGNYQALKSIINDIKKNNIDKTIFLGDSVSLGPDSLLCLELLNKTDIIQILGNHEIYCLQGIQIDPFAKKENFEYQTYLDNTNIKQHIKTNLLKYELNLNNKKILFTHYFLSNEEYPYMNLRMFENPNYIDILNNIDYDYVIYGHEHRKDYHETNNKKFYGIGSSGCTKNNKTYYYIIDSKNNKINIYKKTIKYNRNKLINSINHKKYPQKEQIMYKYFNIK